LRREMGVRVRAAVLARLTAGPRTARIYRRPAAPPLVLTVGSAAECRERFATEVAADGIRCHIETSPVGVRERVRLFGDEGRALSWDDHLPHGVGSVLGVVARDSSRDEEPAHPGVVVTGCHAAITVTHARMMLSGPGHSRTVSLLAPARVAVVRPQDFYCAMEEFLAREASPLAAESCGRVMTGPGRTADLAPTPTLGVHGPGRVVVVGPQ
jgi:hypothetical protein